MPGKESAQGQLRQSCAGCGQAEVKAVTVTSMVVYIRCQLCGEVWTVPERRKRSRTGDPSRI